MIDHKNPSAVKMKRLTERDEYGNADIIGVDSADLQENLEFEQLNLVTCALNQLAYYEESELEAENDILQADNAELYKTLGQVNEDPQIYQNVLSKPHPGAALLKELEQLRAVRDAAEKLSYDTENEDLDSYNARMRLEDALAQAKGGA
jgi:hypothetical protein